MNYSVELGLCESYGGDVGQWYTLTFPVDVPEAISAKGDAALEHCLFWNAREQVQRDLAASDITIAHIWLYFYEVAEEETA